MTCDIDEVTAAFRTANPVAGGAFEDTARGPEAEQSLRNIMASRPPWIARHRWTRPVIMAAPLAGLAAAAAVALVLVTSGGGATTHISTAAYTVTRTPDGAVTVVFNSSRAFTDPSGLSRALAREGVPNRVLLGRTSCPPGSSTYGKEVYSRNVLSAGPGAGSVVVHSQNMPPGAVLVITVVGGPGAVIHGPGQITIPQGGYFVIGTNLTDRAPTCVSYTGPR